MLAARAYGLVGRGSVREISARGGDILGRLVELDTQSAQERGYIVSHCDVLIHLDRHVLPQPRDVDQVLALRRVAGLLSPAKTIDCESAIVGWCCHDQCSVCRKGPALGETDSPPIGGASLYKIAHSVEYRPTRTTSSSPTAGPHGCLPRAQPQKHSLRAPSSPRPGFSGSARNAAATARCWSAAAARSAPASQAKIEVGQSEQPSPNG